MTLNMTLDVTLNVTVDVTLDVILDMTARRTQDSGLGIQVPGPKTQESILSF